MTRHYLLLGIALSALVGAFTFGTSRAEAQRPIPVNIESTPPGAAVFVDTVEGSAPIGTTPMRNVRVPRGNHTLIFRLANHEENRLAVNIRRRRETFRVVLAPLGTIAVTAGNEAANTGSVRIDGQPVGTVPFSQNVQPGRHMVQVGREGYVTYSQWTDVAGGQIVTIPVMLEEEAAETGSILVASDVSGSPIFVDGEPRGQTPSVLDGIPAGDHTIEVRPTDSSLQAFSQSVRVIAGERAVINASLQPEAPPGGSVTVICNAPDCQITLDGQSIGGSPASQTEVSPGQHIIEAMAPNHERATQTITVVAGQQSTTSIELSAGASGAIVVNANVSGATVMIDGVDRGAPPVIVNDAPAGTHAIVVRALNHEEFRTTCDTGPGQRCEITAELSALGVPVRIVTPQPGATVVIDGAEVGTTPWQGSVPVGEHRLDVTQEGMRPYSAPMPLTQTSETQLFDVPLVGADTLTQEERAERARRRDGQARVSMSRAAAPLGDDLAVADISLGWPYLAEGRLAVGFLNLFEIGFAFRTNFIRLYEFEGQFKLGWRPVRQASVGALFRIGGGLGPSRDTDDDIGIDAELINDPATDDDLRMQLMNDGSHGRTNDFFLSLEARGTLHFGPAGGVTLGAAVDYYRDTWAWNAFDHECRVVQGCPDGATASTILTSDPVSDQVLSEVQNSIRFRLSVTFELIMSRRWNGWAQFEAAFGPARRVMGDVLFLGHDDTRLYARIGMTYKFGDVSDFIDLDDDSGADAPY